MDDADSWLPLPIWSRSFRTTVARVALMVWWMTTSAVSAADTVTVTDILGTRTSGTIKTWDRDKIVIEGASDAGISRAVVRSVAFEHLPQKSASSASTILLSNGDRISARAVSVADDILLAAWPIMGDAAPLKIPLERIVAAILEMPPTKADALRLLADLDTAGSGSDLVMLSNGDHSQGEFERLDAAFVQLKVGKTTLKLDRSRVRAIRLNPELVNATRSVGRRALLTLTDGSRVTASQVELQGDTLVLKSPSLGELGLPVTAIATCQYFGERVIPITDYEPAKVEFTPYLSTSWSLTPNANVLHGPLSIRGVEFSTGLGTHSRMAVTYELHGDERTFESLVGIDDVANGAGSVMFAVDLDGRPMWTSAEITGRSAAAPVPEIAVRGGKRMTLRVEFGQFSDVSDYADWCDAVFILGKSR